jgi:hypothetical protein
VQVLPFVARHPRLAPSPDGLTIHLATISYSLLQSNKQVNKQVSSQGNK